MAQQTTENTAKSEQASKDSIRNEIRALSNPSYRARQLARWRLEQSPLETLDGIEECLDDVDFNTGGQLIDLLSALSTHNDVAVNIRAREMLRSHANRVSSLGRKADTAERAIADLQEAQAVGILTHHGARFGSPKSLGFVLNGLDQDSNDLALCIDETFTGDDGVVSWIQFLKSVDTVFFQGPNINSQHLQGIAQIPGIRNVKLKHVSLTAADLQMFDSFQFLELLELSYVDIDDSALELLAKLPISQSLRLFGTKVSKEGAERLAGQLDGIEIYCGRGGYLGISTTPSNTKVNRVVDGSGAFLAGIRINDELTHVDDIAISNMADLRVELGKHTAGDRIVISLRRTEFRISELELRTAEVVEMKLEVTLGEDPN